MMTNESGDSTNPLSIAYVGNVEQIIDISARRLVREALTLMEVSFVDGQNQKAIKDSLKQIIWKNIKNIKNEVEQSSFSSSSSVGGEENRNLTRSEIN